MYIRLRVSVCFLLLSSLLHIQLIANDGQYLFKQFSVEKGFNSHIQKIKITENGMVWFYSKDGLGRFDGFNLKLYDETHYPQLPISHFISYFEDDEQQLWILTEKGLFRYIYQTDSFEQVFRKNKQIVDATAAIQDKEGILFYTPKELLFYDYRSKDFHLICRLHSHPHFRPHTLLKWDKNTLLCVHHWKGVYLLDIRDGSLTLPPLGNTSDISQVYIDSQYRIWVARYNKGVTCYERTGKVHSSYSVENGNLTHNVVLCMTEHQQQIWIGTDGGGINIISPEKGSTTTIEHIAGIPNSLPVNSIQSLAGKPDTPYMWAGSIRGGLINIRPSFIRFHGDSPLRISSGLSDKTVISLYQDDEDIWIGTDGGGINRYHPSTGFQHFPQTWGRKIASICKLNEEELLISEFSKGLYRFHKKNGKISPLRITSSIDSISKYSRKTVNLFQNHDKSIFILSSELYRFNPATKRTFRIDLSSLSAPIVGYVLGIGSDKEGSYFYDRHQLFKIGDNNKAITIYRSKLPINGATRDSEGQLWIATPKGLFRINPISCTITFHLSNSLLNKAESIIGDFSNRIWITTRTMLFAWSNREQRLYSFGESEGVEPNEYISKASLATTNGSVFLGGNKGMLQIDRFPSTNPYDIPQLFLADIVANEESVMPQIEEKHSIELPTETKTLTINVRTQEMDILRNKLYRFILTGKDEPLQIETTEPHIVLRSLNPGSYHLSVSCTLRDGSWSTPKTLIHFNILAPIYLRTWAIFLEITLVITFLAITILLLFKRKEEKLQLQMEENNRKSVEERVRYLINFNHELRTPLTLIHTPLSMLLQQTKKDHPHFPILRNVFHQSERMKNLLNTVLSLRKMEVQEGKLELAAYPLNNWIKEMLSEFSYEAENAEINFDFVPDERINNVFFDYEKHKIIFSNLIVNALKYAPRYSSIHIYTQLHEEKVSIHVADQGEGIPPQDIDNLFTRFYQGENAKSGIGLGLAHAKAFVELHGGTITVHNQPEGGACFIYSLPIKAIENTIVIEPQVFLRSDNHEEKHPIDAETAKIETSNYSILIVENDPELLQLMKNICKNHFQRMYTTTNGAKAMEIISKTMPDLVVSDIRLPMMDGYELCKRIKEDNTLNHIQVILMTSRSDESDYIKGYQLGADAYLEKPFEIHLFFETVKNRLYSREIARDRYTSLSGQKVATINSANDAFLYKLNGLIIDHLDCTEMNIDFLCKNMAISRATLYNRLKQLTDTGANEYIQKIRMQKAMELLTTTDLNINEVAYKVGFSTARYFSTAFKQYTGMTPTHFKEKGASTIK